VKGDNLGTPAESAIKATWPDYNAEYLKDKLRQNERRFNRDGLEILDANGNALASSDVMKQVYLQEAVKGYEGDAEACLKHEFDQWLQGTHSENYEAENGLPKSYYDNAYGDGPKRRHVFEGEVSAQMADDTGWQATRWGTKPLTHLAGVREYLREGKIKQDNAERDMNLLAEYGPQDLNEAWMYFKHWVKKRPVVTCEDKGVHNKTFDVDNALYRDRMNGIGPSNWMSTDDRNRNYQWAAQAPPPPAQAPQSRAQAPPSPAQAPDPDIGDAARSATAEAMADLAENVAPPQWAASRDKGLVVDDDDQPGRKQKVAFTATASSPKRSSHRPPTVYDRPIYDHPTDPISGTKHMGAHQMWTGTKDPNKVANTMPFKYGFQTDRGEKRPNPAMNHVWANNQANQALKRARCSGFQYDVNLMSSNRSPLPPTWQ
jgi:hypothetical protein